LFITLLGVAGIGCGDSTSHPDLLAGDLAAVVDMAVPGDAMVLVSYTQFIQDRAQRLCAHEVVCGRLAGDVTSLQNCIRQQTVPKGWDIDTDINRGWLSVDELTCLNAIQTARCDNSDIGFVSAQCLAHLLLGHQQANDSCHDDSECSNGYCAHLTGDAGTPQPTGCPGTCTAFKNGGDPCVRDEECNLQIAYCNGTCTLFPTVGMACDPSIGCAPGLLCPSFAASPMCQTVSTVSGGLNSPCDPDQASQTSTPPCQPNLYCQVQYDVGHQPTGGLCKAQLAVNTSCNLADVTTPVLGVVLFEDNPCVQGSTCYVSGTGDLSASTKCQALGGTNAPCAENGQCMDTLYCQKPGGSQVGTCQSLQQDNTPCTPGGPNVCLSGSAFVGQRCVVPNADAGGMGICEPLKGYGAPCQPGFDDSLCVPNAAQNYCAPTSTGNLCQPKCF
jgi:hypothetical protein